jgi:ubiquinone/menaquinone biosynthesis C-methylase UbiE
MGKGVGGPLAVIRSAVAQLHDTHILDIGCGEGGLARQFAAERALVTGIDPLAQAIAKARANVPEARFEIATAEALPFGDQTFDLAVMLNALHHVPAALMGAALLEARRVLRENGTLVIIEPLASGNFFDAMRRIEDETEVRRQAQLALAFADPLFATHRALDYVRRETYDTVEQFIARIVAVDPARQAVVNADRAAILAEVHRAALETQDGALAFDQPIKADIFTNPR